MVFTDITDQLERAARNGTKAHLAADLVRAIVAHPAYALIQAERTKELVSSWDDRQPMPPPAASKSEPIGSNIEPNATTGPSAGTMQPHVHAAAERLASEQAQTMGRRKRRGKPLPATT
jgi:hypothetical protein